MTDQHPTHQLTEDILQFWRETDAFAASLRSSPEKRSFTFYDGPPFTSGDPHYGHLLQSIVKDMVPRWMTMRGYHVNRKRGWDCHGIPAENFVNKQLGITSRKEIEEEFGIRNYIEACRTMVNNVNTHRKRTVDHVGRRVDMDNAYFTMSNEFMESVICVFSDLYNRNLIYKGFKVLGYSRALGTALSNSEIAEGYEMRQDPAVTVKLPLKNTNLSDTTIQYNPHDGAIEVVAGVIKDEAGRLLMIYENRHSIWFCPGGKIDAGETPTDALRREVREELGVEVTNEKFLGRVKTVHKGKIFRMHYFEVTISGSPVVQEPEKHGKIARVEKIAAENAFGYQLKADDLVITDEQQLRHEFSSFHFIEQGLFTHRETGDAPICLLPWTTTPWTLPANMFAAVHNDIRYVELYDLSEKCYFILAEACIEKYYPSPEQYIHVLTVSGREVVGLGYTPLFPYYQNAPTIADEYKTQVHRVLHADFVTTESGTGVVHEAPAFGVDDYELVCTIFPREQAQEWLFDPVNAYGEFTALVPDFVGQNVIVANGAIIKDLKARGLLVKQETISHSYPHCPRTGTPLIYKAIESRFLKEEELKAKTVPAAQDIHFVPDTVKARFINGLDTAPDRNISRTRFRGCPLPVWQSADGMTTKVVGSIDEIYQLNKPNKQLTKLILVRHCYTDYNEQGRLDCADEARLTDIGHDQANRLAQTLKDVKIDAIYCSPFTRCQQTCAPLVESSGLIPTIDARLREVDFPGLQGAPIFNPDGSYTGNRNRNDDPVDHQQGESIKTVYARMQSVMEDILHAHPGETVVICSHGDPLYMARKFFHAFDYDDTTAYNKRQIRNSTSHIPYAVEYIDAATNKPFDLHRPYVDDIVLTDPKTGKPMHRIPEVLDCWFESGSMPYGQDHWMKNTGPNASNTFPNCADFIAEGLDQTRGWFRALHVLGHAYHDQNVFRNIVVTGMILAEDGKKMSKRLQNYPDPSELLNHYGADALRVYLLSSPVVRAEPLRFSEKAVEQMLKDVVIPLQNVSNFLQMYAEVDQWKHPGTQVRFMRHALKKKLAIVGETDTAWITEEGETIEDIDLPLSEEGEQQLSSPAFIEQLMHIRPDVIVCSEFLRAKQTAEGAQTILAEYLGRAIEIEYTTDRGLGAKPDSIGELHNTLEPGEYASDAQPISAIYQALLRKHAGKRILIVSHKRRLRYLRQWLFGIEENINTLEANQRYFLESGCSVPLPLVPLTNELDQRIMATLHQTGLAVDGALQAYALEDATKAAIDFIDALTNRWVRRSRRRFWAPGMDADKEQAYMTLYTVLQQYLRMLAPTVPFVSESLRQLLAKITAVPMGEHPSIHTAQRPLRHPLYVNQPLIDEITQVRAIITGALYLRAKKQIKVKQPLQSLHVRML